MREELNHRFGPAAVTSGGLQIRTTLVPRLQRLAKRAIATYFHHRYDPAAALVAIDPHTGAIKAMAAIAPGRRGLQFNLASQGHRQAGSAFKPFVLATAVNEGISLDSTFNGPPSIVIPDPECYTNGLPWIPHNNADETGGTMNLFQATAGSVIKFVAPFLPDAAQRALADGDFKISYTDYDWSLNDFRSSSQR